MSFTVLNKVLEHPIKRYDTIQFDYPEGKNPGRYYGAMNHTVSFNAQFFRSPKDVRVIFHSSKIEMQWLNQQEIPAGTILNIQFEEPGGELYHDRKYGVTVPNTVQSGVYMINLGQPWAEDPTALAEPVTPQADTLITLKQNTIDVARSVTIHAEGDASDVLFSITGLDYHDHYLTEHIQGPNADMVQTQKTFKKVLCILPDRSANTQVTIGTGRKLGLPVFLPGSGFVIRYMVDGRGLKDGTIMPGYAGKPGPDTGDVRGTFIPPADIALDGQQTLQMLVSLFNPGNLGNFDYFDEAHVNLVAGNGTEGDSQPTAPDYPRL